MKNYALKSRTFMILLALLQTYLEVFSYLLDLQLVNWCSGWQLIFAFISTLKSVLIHYGTYVYDDKIPL